MSKPLKKAIKSSGDKKVAVIGNAMPDLKYIKKIWDSLRKPKVIVIGDVMLDQFTYGDVDRISPEAPVSVVRHIRSEFAPGGAANVALNLIMLNVRPVLFGVIGRDHVADKLVSLCRDYGIRLHLIKESDRPTALKHRIIARNQHLLRIDQEVTTPISSYSEAKLLASVKKELPTCKGIVLSDYAKGVLTPNLVSSMIKLVKNKKIPILADIKPINKNLFIGVDLIKPNLKEAQDITGEKEVRKVGKALVKLYKSDILLSRGSEGMSAFPKDGSKPLHFSAVLGKARDISGAGDTVMAVATVCKIAKFDLATSAYLSNLAGGISVQKYGTTPVSYDELLFHVSDKYHIDTAYTVEKVWGYEKWLDNNEKYCCKLLFVKKGYQCSLHFHKNKDETFFIIRGHIRLELGKDVLHFRAGHHVRIPPGTPHRFLGMEDTEIIESSTHHDEADSYRLELSRKA